MKGTKTLLITTYVIAILCLAVLAVSAENPSNGNTAPSNSDGGGSGSSSPKALGSSSAPVHIIEYTDFQCPYCKQFATNTLGTIKSNYIDTGKVYYEFRNFPLSFHPYAFNAAKAFQCAAAQGNFWEMHNYLFSNSPDLDDATLKSLAVQIGLNADEFNSCFDSTSTTVTVTNDIAKGTADGVSGTPSFFINGKMIVGAQPYAVFEQAINEALTNDSQLADIGVEKVTAVVDSTLGKTYMEDGDVGSFHTIFRSYSDTPSGQFEVDYYVDNVFLKRETVRGLNWRGDVVVTVPSYTYKEGSHVFKVVVDPNNQMQETNKDNNVYSLPFTVGPKASKPDFIIQGISLSPANPTQGDLVTITFSFKNIGNAPGQLWYNAMLSKQYANNAAASAPSTDSRYLQPGEVYTTTVQTTLSDVGYYTASATADPNNLVDESNELNNFYSTMFYVNTKQTGLPDLTVDHITVTPENPKVGEITRIDIVYKNIGTVKANPSTSYGLPGRKAAPTSIVGDTFFDPQDTYEVTNWVIMDTSGYYDINANIDIPNSITESNELNNALSKRIYVASTNVSQPDFVVESIIVSPSNPVQGSSAKISYTFRNIGTVDAQLWYYVTLDRPNKVSPTAASAQSLQQRYLQPGESYTTTVDTELPDAGYYTARAVADPNNNFIELNENNNEKSLSFYVTPQTTADITAYLDQSFVLGKGQSAMIADYKNLKVAWSNFDGTTLTLLVGNIVEKQGKIILHRDHLNCADDSPVTTAPNGGKNQVFAVGEGTSYWNFECKNRKQEQCYGDGTFDTYYNEWCEYPETQAGTQRTIKLKVGGSEKIDGATISLLSMSGNNAKLLVSKNPSVADVNIGIEPRTATIQPNEKAQYSLVIKDGHSLPGTYTYTLTSFGLPFSTDLPSTIDVESGKSKTIVFTVDTSQKVDVTSLAKVDTSQISISVNRAGNYNNGQGTEQILFEDDQSAQDYCLNNADSVKTYNSCIKKIKVKKINPQTEDSATYASYRFAIRAYSKDASDVAYATLNLKQELPPTFPQPDTTKDVTVTLDKGWNLVSLSGSRIVQFKDNQCGQKLIAFVYLNDQQKYVSLVKAKSILGDEFTDFLSRNGFWVYAYNDCKLTVAVQKDIVYNDLGLQAGWNLLPITQDMVGKSLEGIDNTCNIQKMYAWNSNTQKWSVLSESYIFQKSNLYQGILVKTDNYCQLGNIYIDNPPAFPN